MRKYIFACVCIPFLLSFCHLDRISEQNSWIRINQLGYAPAFNKIAVFVSKASDPITGFSIYDAVTNQIVWESKDIENCGPYGPFNSTYRLRFTGFEQQGNYFISAKGIVSPEFTISTNVYDQTADFLLKYMRQQRCGYNPFLEDSCHVQDGFTIYGPMPDGTHIDVTGGWHDATDYLQYVATSANAVTNMLMAYRDNPFSFQDHYNADGHPGSNLIPDIEDEARWGLSWLEKMHPRSDWMFNQIADDRDHAGFRLPNKDSVSYGQFPGRPVYFCNGEPQVLFKYTNRTTGTASTAGKFSAAFALAGQVLGDHDKKYLKKARSAYQFGLAQPGACQTAPGRAPYFYEEDNWVDDMELGAAAMNGLASNQSLLDQALDFARQEPVTPWMGADTARHYQWYPFINLGHYELSRYLDKENRKQVLEFYREGIDRVWQKGAENAFRMGVPFIWCSNNLVTAMVTQCYLYRVSTGDSTFLEMESALRDWLFGCNPWGVSMIIGLPEGGVTAKDPHSSLSHLYGFSIDGGLLDGPVYNSIYRRQQYVHLNEPDEYAGFQSELAVYHDDFGDYVTDEPTMDGTASLVYYLSALQKEAHEFRMGFSGRDFTFDQDAIVRGKPDNRRLALVFTGDEYADGAEPIRLNLAKHGIKASFFLTGKFYRNTKFAPAIKSLIADGHYLGAHSDQHLLYCTWENRDSLLVNEEKFSRDLYRNYIEMERFGISRSDAEYFLPPYEWYNQQISRWTRRAGLQLINYTPGTLSHTDYTIPSMKAGYYSSRQILESVFSFAEESDLNGFILLMHIGTHPGRTDKLYRHLDDLIGYLKSAGYDMVRIDQLLSDN